MKMKKIRKILGVIFMTCVMLFVPLRQSDAATATMTQAEKKVFNKWLITGIKKTEYGSYYMSKTQGIMYNPQFYVCDINGDGHKDVIVTGRLGMRTMTYSEVYMHVDGKYKVIPVEGSLYGLSSRGIYMVMDDYSYAGAVRYHSLLTYRFDKHGRVSRQYQYRKVTMYYDVDRKIKYKDGKVTSITCTTSSGKKLNMREFKRERAVIYKKNVAKKMHDVNRNCVNKYLK